MALTAQQERPSQLTFSEKFGLKYYSFIITQILALFILLTTRSSTITLAFISFYNGIGFYLPIKATDDKYVNKIQNTNKLLLGPLICSCISTPTILAVIWQNYEAIITDSISQTIILLFAISYMISGSIDASHQLLHRPQAYSKFFCYLNLIFMQFTIYPTEHLYLHHKKVGTSQDPITSPKNQNVYSYYINALISCYKFTYNYSKKIFATNIVCMIAYNLLLLAFAIKEGSSWHKAAIFSAISYTTLFIMESVEYVEHYGLVYRTNQKTKPVTEICSWNTQQNQLLNWYVFKFQRHSDHHMNAYKIYPTMELTQKMPRLPFSFPLGVILTHFPALWKKLVNPLVDQVIQGKTVSKQHHKLISRIVSTVNLLLCILFPIRLGIYLSK